MKFKRNQDIEKILKKHKNKQKGMSPFCYLNPNAGNIEKSADMFNSSVGNMGNEGTANSTTSSIGEGLKNELNTREEIFQKIKAINPNANRSNYDKYSIRKMLAIYNSYVNKNKKIDKTNINKISNKYQKGKDKLPVENDVYFNKNKGNFMIHGLNLQFETEDEAINFARELKKEEKENEKEN